MGWWLNGIQTLHFHTKTSIVFGLLWLSIEHAAWIIILTEYWILNRWCDCVPGKSNILTTLNQNWVSKDVKETEFACVSIWFKRADFHLFYIKLIFGYYKRSPKPFKWNKHTEYKILKLSQQFQMRSGCLIFECETICLNLEFDRHVRFSHQNFTSKSEFTK